MLWPSSLLVMLAHNGPALTKDMQTEHKEQLCWSGMTDIEHRTSGSNEEDRLQHKLVQRLVIKFNLIHKLNAPGACLIFEKMKILSVPYGLKNTESYNA